MPLRLSLLSTPGLAVQNGSWPEGEVQFHQRNGSELDAKNAQTCNIIAAHYDPEGPGQMLRRMDRPVFAVVIDEPFRNDGSSLKPGFYEQLLDHALATGYAGVLTASELVAERKEPVERCRTARSSHSRLAGWAMSGQLLPEGAPALRRADQDHRLSRSWRGRRRPGRSSDHPGSRHCRSVAVSDG